MNVLVTGSNGFLGKNLVVHLKELGIHTKTFTRQNSLSDLKILIKNSDFIVHLAGENRPADEKDFNAVNFGITESICAIVKSLDKKIPIIFTSSVQVLIDNAYGQSKFKAEEALKKLNSETASPIYIYRLPGVFGKWCRPNYNSVVATFCHNISKDLPVKVNDPSAFITLVYIDDVINEFISLIKGDIPKNEALSVNPQYKVNLGQLADQIKSFKESRNSLQIDKVGKGFIRKLYSTYLSYLSPSDFEYSISSQIDDRGIFAEVLKTKDSGQFSFFTAEAGITRGGHYHHTKTEKFLVIKGKAKFIFRNIDTHETHEIIATSKKLKIIETIPGWAHDITNIGKSKLIVMLWANEIFDRNKPDTITYRM